MESTLLAYRENAGKGEEKVLIWRFRRWKLNEEEEDDEEKKMFFKFSQISVCCGSKSVDSKKRVRIALRLF